MEYDALIGQSQHDPKRLLHDVTHVLFVSSKPNTETVLAGLSAAKNASMHVHATVSSKIEHISPRIPKNALIVLMCDSEESVHIVQACLSQGFDHFWVDIGSESQDVVTLLHRSSVAFMTHVPFVSALLQPTQHGQSG